MAWHSSFSVFLSLLLVRSLTFVSSFEIHQRSALCCRKLSNRFKEQISYPASSVFADQQTGPVNGYWSQQEASINPSCRFTPNSPVDVANAVELLTSRQCRFAVRGGGHMSWAGAANIEDGVTIDLGSMRQIVISSDKSTTLVGGGARWFDVYSKLDQQGLAVSGGRVFDVGVGGLTLGGGNTFFGPRYGFACDNVRNFEVVLASGNIVNANATSNSDLFKALKGGSNNFGIVTRFDLKTFQQGDLWGGFIINAPGSIDQQLQALQSFTQASGVDTDPYAALINSYIFQANGLSFIANYMTHTKPQAYPPAFSNFTSIQPQLQNTLRMSKLTNLTVELGAGTPNGYRQIFGTATFKNDATLSAKILSLANMTFASVKHRPDFQLSVTFQADFQGADE